MNNEYKKNVFLYRTNLHSTLDYNEEKHKYTARAGSRSCNEFPVCVDIAAGGWIKENNQQHVNLISSQLNLHHHVTCKYGNGEYKTGKLKNTGIYEGKRADEYFEGCPSVICIDFDNIQIDENEFILKTINKYNYFITFSKNHSEKNHKYHVYFLLKNEIKSKYEFDEFIIKLKSFFIQNKIDYDESYVPQGVIHRTQGYNVRIAGCSYGSKYIEDLFNDPQFVYTPILYNQIYSEKENKKTKKQKNTNKKTYQATDFPPDFFDSVFNNTIKGIAGFDSVRINQEAKEWHAQQFDWETRCKIMKWVLRISEPIPTPIIKEGTRFNTAFLLASHLLSYFIFDPIETWSRIYSFYQRGGFENTHSFSLHELKRAFIQAYQKCHDYTIDNYLQPALDKYEHYQDKKLFLTIKFLHDNVYMHVVNTCKDEINKLFVNKKRYTFANKRYKTYIAEKFLNVLHLINYDFGIDFSALKAKDRKILEKDCINKIINIIEQNYNNRKDKQWVSKRTSVFETIKQKNVKEVLTITQIKNKLDNIYIHHGITGNELEIEMYYNILCNRLQYDNRYFKRFSNYNVDVRRTLELKNNIISHNNATREENYKNICKHIDKCEKQTLSEITKDEDIGTFNSQKGMKKIYWLDLLKDKRIIYFINKPVIIKPFIDTPTSHHDIYKLYLNNNNNINKIILNNISTIINNKHKCYKFNNKKENDNNIIINDIFNINSTDFKETNLNNNNYINLYDVFNKLSYNKQMYITNNEYNVNTIKKGKGIFNKNYVIYNKDYYGINNNDWNKWITKDNKDNIDLHYIPTISVCNTMTPDFGDFKEKIVFLEKSYFKLKNYIDNLKRFFKYRQKNKYNNICFSY